MDNNDTPSNQDFISNTELSSIYKKISIEPDTNFDDEEINQMIIDVIETIFDENILRIESKILITDINKLNNTFVKIVKTCNTQENYKNVSKMFLVFCDYFDLDYNRCYTNLHEKLQKLIEAGFIKLLGGKKKYIKLKRKLNPSNVVTIFDLIK